MPQLNAVVWVQTSILHNHTKLVALQRKVLLQSELEARRVRSVFNRSCFCRIAPFSQSGATSALNPHRPYSVDIFEKKSPPGKGKPLSVRIRGCRPWFPPVTQIMHSNTIRIGVLILRPLLALRFGFVLVVSLAFWLCNFSKVRNEREIAHETAFGFIFAIFRHYNRNRKCRTIPFQYGRLDNGTKQ